MPSRSLVPTTLVAVALLGATLTGCGVGQNPETYRERPTADAALASVGQLELRNVRIAAPRAGAEEYAVGADAPVTLTVVNTAERDDALVSVSSTAATTVDLLDADGTPVRQVPLAQGLSGPDQFSVVLRTLAGPLRPGQTIPITFTFRDGGRETLLVPIAIHTEPAPVPTENVFEHASEGEGER